MPLDFAISALVTLLVVVDPVGLAPTFLAVTEGLPAQARQSVALRAALIAGAILIGSALIGDWLLRALGISLPRSASPADFCCSPSPSRWCSARACAAKEQAAEQAVEERVRNLAAFPLAIPLLAGPGAITATVLLAGRAAWTLLLVGILIAVVVFVAGACICLLHLRRPNRPAARLDREYRPVTPARRAACRARGAIRRRRNSRAYSRPRAKRLSGNSKICIGCECARRRRPGVLSELYRSLTEDRLCAARELSGGQSLRES